MHYFTITAGRTGTAWLASFLSKNLNIEEIHEHLGINDFGEKMPDIRTMRNFNNFGNNGFVQEFWKRKFASIHDKVYAETNHTLSKCGLVENVILNNRSNSTTLIILKRQISKQCQSYLIRNDFANVTLAWQWYLLPQYSKKLINPDPFFKFGKISLPLWYCYEMEARQEYYYQKFSNYIRMINLNLEDAITENGAKKFFNELGLKTSCLLPPPKNENKVKINNELMEILNKIIRKIDIDMPQLVKKAINKGFTF